MLNVSISLTPDVATQAQLNRIEGMLEALTKGAISMAVDLTALTAQVAANTDLENSAITLIQALAAEFAAAAADPGAVAALATRLKASATALAAAISANTTGPVAPAPTPPESSGP